LDTNKIGLLYRMFLRSGAEEYFNKKKTLNTKYSGVVPGPKLSHYTS
jgi:hypothetical protein